eukprot:2167806-Prymnesium_polylepis.2
MFGWWAFRSYTVLFRRYPRDHAATRVSCQLDSWGRSAERAMHGPSVSAVACRCRVSARQTRHMSQYNHSAGDPRRLRASRVGPDRTRHTAVRPESEWPPRRRD